MFDTKHIYRAVLIALVLHTCGAGAMLVATDTDDATNLKISVLNSQRQTAIQTPDDMRRERSRLLAPRLQAMNMARLPPPAELENSLPEGLSAAPRWQDPQFAVLLGGVFSVLLLICGFVIWLTRHAWLERAYVENRMHALLRNADESAELRALRMLDARIRRRLRKLERS